MSQDEDQSADTRKLYIAGTGMITSVGVNTSTTVAAINAGKSAYKTSREFFNQFGDPITVASVPDSLFDEVEMDLDEGDRFSPSHDRMTKMAIIALHEACDQQPIEKPVPLLLSMPDVQIDKEGLAPLIVNLEQNCEPWVSRKTTRNLPSGRAAGIEAIQFVFDYLYEQMDDFVLVGGSDCYFDDERLAPLLTEDRLLTSRSADAFVPGEAAGFLLLTKRPELAKVHDGYMIALSPPGVAKEEGHLHSDEPYRGEGLAAAFKMALATCKEQSVHSIYSTMNGERHWAKEYGVAYLRNRPMFLDPVTTQHPADCYGDVGSASGSLLVALAAQHLLNTPKATAHLVYGSADTGQRAAVVVEKLVAAKPA